MSKNSERKLDLSKDWVKKLASDALRKTRPRMRIHVKDVLMPTRTPSGPHPEGRFVGGQYLGEK